MTRAIDAGVRPGPNIGYKTTTEGTPNNPKHLHVPSAFRTAGRIFLTSTVLAVGAVGVNEAVSLAPDAEIVQNDIKVDFVPTVMKPGYEYPVIMVPAPTPAPINLDVQNPSQNRVELA